jgi:hypothetical protein
VSVLESVGDYLQAQGRGTLATSLFLGVMPDQPDVATCVYEKPGTAPSFTLGTGGVAVDRPGLQVIVRAARGDYPGGRDRALLVRSSLAAVVEQTLTGVLFHRIEPEGWVIPLGEDEIGRPMFSLNFQCWVAP